MNILISSHAFAPSVGGIETVSAILAREWARVGHTVEIVTQTPGEPEWEGLSVYRRLSAYQLRQKVRTADLYLQNNISLRSLWPALGCGTQTAVLHQTYLWAWDGRPGLAGYLKQGATHRLRNLSISLAVAKALPADTPITGNPYDAATFRLLPEVNRKRAFIFVGRLVSDKGVHVLLEAFRLLQQRDISNQEAAQLTIVGAGPEEEELRAEATDLNVIFAGVLQGKALAEALNEHSVLVIPSLWPEPFGIVALEGAACGCRVIGSDQGGLPEAIGPCGATFPNGDAHALAKCMYQALEDPYPLDQNLAREHLQRHAPAAFARRILELATN
ncbi:MAG: glycosyltransferase [Puniceicoccaceae bacterium]|nr:MAG: glycosyltransferase [Puniceicoccaceae bacterium]